MVEKIVGEEESSSEEDAGSPMWKFLNEEYDYKRPKRGDIRYAEVMSIGDDEIIVDIGGKTEGIVPKGDLQRMGPEALAEIEVGDKVPVYVLRPESADGDVIVSLNMARTMEDWRRAEKLFEDGDIFEGTVSGHNKGGLLVYFGRIRGFVPSSQLTGLGRRTGHESRMEMLSKMEGQEMTLKVIEVDRQRRRLILSQRAAAREWREKRKADLLNELQEGDILTGAVRNLCDFGAFVDLGGADGLIHISELSWRRVKHAREVLNVGDEVEVYVLRVDRERKRIGLSLKRLQPDPWHVAEEAYEVGQIVKGMVTNIVDFGAFARIEDGIEGLIHVSELSDGDFAPQDLVREGEELYVKILSIDADRQRMGLSLKQAPSIEEVEGKEALAEMRSLAAVELEEEGEVAVEPDAETKEPSEPLVEAVEELTTVVEPVEVEELVAEGEEELEAAVEAVEELETAVEIEEVAAEEEEEPEAAAEAVEDLEVAVEAEEEAEAELTDEVMEELEAAVEVGELVAEEEEEPEAAVEAVEELEVAVGDEEEAEAELTDEALEELEAAVEVEELVAEEEEEPEAAAEAVEDLEVAVEAEEEDSIAEEAEAELTDEAMEELEAAVEVEELVAEEEEEPEAAAEAVEELEVAVGDDDEVSIPEEAEAELTDEVVEELEAAVEPGEIEELVVEEEEEPEAAAEAVEDLEVAVEAEEEAEAELTDEAMEELEVAVEVEEFVAEEEEELEAAVEAVEELEAAMGTEEEVSVSEETAGSEVLEDVADPALEGETRQDVEPPDSPQES